MLTYLRNTADEVAASINLPNISWSTLCSN